MNCVRNYSLVQCFPLFVTTDFVSVFGFEHPLAIINPLEFTSLSNYWLAVVLVPLTIFSMTVFNKKISPFGFVLFGNANVLN